MAYYKVHNKGSLWRHEELVAAGTITPGMLCEVTSDGEVQAHSTEGGRAERLIAQEDALQGKGVDTDYSADAIVSLAVAGPGDVFNMLVALGEAGDPGEPVISDGNGALKTVDNATSAAVVVQVIGYIDASETAFTTLAAAALKAIRLV